MADCPTGACMAGMAEKVHANITVEVPGLGEPGLNEAVAPTALRLH